MMISPDYERAAITAMETIVKYGITSTPVSPMPILKRLPGVLIISYEDMSNDMSEDRNRMISLFGKANQDAFTSVHIQDGHPHYIVTYNQRLPLFLVQRALSRELGHILLKHDGTKPEDIRHEEAKCFAHHFLVPRPLIHAVEKAGIRLTVEVVGNLTGCYDYCLSCMRATPKIVVPAELNRTVRDQFLPYIANFIDFQKYATKKDGSHLADFGTYMDGYEE